MLTMLADIDESKRTQITDTSNNSIKLIIICYGVSF